jgi:lysophospholipid acyltransferase (LPLAT)-like uncharacterized protein
MGPLLTAACRVLARLYRAYYSTIRLDGFMRDGSTRRMEDWVFGPEIYAVSERDILALAGIMTHGSFTVLVAHGADGNWATVVAQALGCDVIRGSSRRGGVAAVGEILERLNTCTTPAAIIVDGPLGPVGWPKAGVLAWSARTGRPIRALAAAPGRAVVFRGTWSQMYLPLPFTQLAIGCDDEWRVPPDLSRAGRTRGAEELAGRMDWARRTATAGLRIPRSELARKRIRPYPSASTR